jgi:carbohydrate kinase (thermoresistant glucokinase family)
MSEHETLTLTRDDTESVTAEVTENTIPDGYLRDAAPILVVMGVCGCGKTSVATAIAERQGWDSAEADDFHPQANIDKMAAGIPLTDEDRWGWLDKLAAWIRGHVDNGKPGVVTCSALKKVYRDKLRLPGVVFVYLSGDYDTVMELLAHRSGHFMKPAMLDSQFAILEPPSADEVHLTLDLSKHLSVEQETQAVIDALEA